MKLFVFLITLLSTTMAIAETSVLFIGNSFTFGWGSSTRYYRADTVTDLNNEGIGGVPALFKAFTQQVGLDYDVFLETRGGSDIQFHLDNKLAAIGQKPWDMVVMHSYSTLNPNDPGNPDALVRSTAAMTDFLRSKNPNVAVYLTATWPRADQVYRPGNYWSDMPLAQMAKTIRQGYDLAAAAPGVAAVNGVGEAWLEAIASGIADANPYDGIEAGKLDLWSYDHYHASHFGYYLEALVVFGNLTGVDPRSLGANECAGFELGMSPAQVSALQEAAYAQLAKESPSLASKVQRQQQDAPLPCSALMGS